MSSKIKLNYAGFAQLRCSDGVSKAVEEQAERMAQNLPHGKTTPAHYSAGRQARVIVNVLQDQTSEDIENNTMLRRMFGG